MTIVRKNRENVKGHPWAKGKRAIAIDQRTGFKELQEEMIFEPGTEYYVKKSESDGLNNLVTDALNYVSDKMKISEAIGLKHPSPDVKLSIGTVIAAASLGLGPQDSVGFYNYPGTSVTSDE